MSLEQYISLKQAFFSSIPEQLAGATERALQAKRKRVIDATGGELQQEVHLALEDIKASHT